jgi:hypothetical protein
VNNKEPFKFKLYRWLANNLPRDLVTAAIIRAFMATGEPAGNGQYHDMPISLLFQRWETPGDRWFYWHWQNLDDGKKGWRNGRAWWSFFHGWLKLRAEWSLFGHSSTAIGFDLAADEEDFQGHLAIYRLFSIWLTVERFEPLHRYFRSVSLGYGYETSIKWHSGSLWVHVLYNEMWGAGSVDRWWILGWVSVWKASRYKDYPDGGFYICFDFDRMIFGSRKLDREKIGEPVTAEIPIEPDNRMGFHYFATFQKQRWTRYRGHFPWWKTVTDEIEVETKDPPLHAGKGENDWDLDDDGIFGVTFNCTTVEEAIAKYQESVYEDRKKYGMPGAILSSPLFKVAEEGKADSPSNNPYPS